VCVSVCVAVCGRMVPTIMGPINILLSPLSCVAVCAAVCRVCCSVFQLVQHLCCRKCHLYLQNPHSSNQVSQLLWGQPTLTIVPSLIWSDSAGQHFYPHLGRYEQQFWPKHVACGAPMVILFIINMHTSVLQKISFISPKPTYFPTIQPIIIENLDNKQRHNIVDIISTSQNISLFPPSSPVCLSKTPILGTL